MFSQEDLVKNYSWKEINNKDSGTNIKLSSMSVCIDKEQDKGSHL